MGLPVKGVSSGRVGSWLTRTSIKGGWKLFSICCVVVTGNFGVQKYSAM